MLVVSFRGQIKLAHAQIGLFQECNSNFLTGTPGLFGGANLQNAEYNCIICLRLVSLTFACCYLLLDRALCNIMLSSANEN